MSGRYDYGEEPDDIYRRHDNCGCKVTYENGRERQDVWTKKSWEVPEIEEPDTKPTVFSSEEAKALEAKQLAKFAPLTGEKSGGIIKLSINLFDKTDPLYLDALSIEEIDGFEDVCIHGSSKSVQKIIDGKLTNMDAKDFADFLRKSTNYKGKDIRLASCSTAKGDNSIAQQLSRELGVKVMAPDSDVYYAPNEGVLFVGCPYANTGKWRIFDNGVEIE